MGTNSAPLLADLFLKAPSITTWCRKPKTNLVCQNRQRPSSLATRSGISTVYIIQRWQRGLCWKLHQGHLPVGIGTYGQLHIINWKCTSAISMQDSSLVIITHLSILASTIRERDDFAFRKKCSSQLTMQWHPSKHGPFLWVDVIVHVCALLALVLLLWRVLYCLFSCLVDDVCV